ncbi:hypothetical protein RR48_00360 [Papilio machaon]|uniref:Uncharacterized protein n=1 Tax=Papilio machaon TaxID=76193 RepID=A0A0N0PFU2_PAPMA|nr:hypothetical protein RR48_00360 [Papilio machaon]
MLDQSYTLVRKCIYAPLRRAVQWRRECGTHRPQKARSHIPVLWRLGGKLPYNSPSIHWTDPTQEFGDTDLDVEFVMMVRKVVPYFILSSMHGRLNGLQRSMSSNVNALVHDFYYEVTI